MQRKQLGLSTINLLLTIICVAVITVLVTKLGPAYMDHVALNSIFEEVSQTIQVSPLDSDEDVLAQYRQVLNRRFNIDAINTVDTDQLKISRGNSRTTINLDYDVRVPIVANIDAVIHFTNEAQVKMQ